MNHPPFRSLLLIALIGLFLSIALVPASSLAHGGNGGGHRKVSTGPVALPTIPTRPLGKPGKLPPPKAKLTSSSIGGLSISGASTEALSDASLTTAETASACATTTTNMKLLVIAADGSEPALGAIKQVLEYQGTPYEVFTAAPKPTDTTTDRLAAKLASSCTANYQGMILTTDSIGYTDSTRGWTSGLTDAEWQTLWSFEATFGIRQVTWYTYPTPDYGFKSEPSPTAFDSTNTPVSANFTAAGKSVFGSYVNTNNALTITKAYTYLAQPLADGATTPLLLDSSDNALAAIRTYTDGRQNLALTFDSNQHLTHNLVLAYGLVNWVTMGVFLGERRTYLSPQPDDLFIADSMWTKETPCDTAVDSPTLPEYRMTGSDLNEVVKWQGAKQALPMTQQLAIEWPYNAVGTTSTYYTEYKNSTTGAEATDTLTSAARQHQAKFKWLNHTYTHANLDAISYDEATTEFSKNNQLASQWKLTQFNKSNLITPDVSGLSNPAAMQAAYDQGVRYAVSDTSNDKNYADSTHPKYIPGYVSPTPNTGAYNNGTYTAPDGTVKNYSILLVPRYPNNLFFNVTLPEQWEALYNCFYGEGGKTPPEKGGWGYDLTYNQILDRESDVLLSYVLKSDMNPWMFHQPNLRAFTGSDGKPHTLLGDLLDATLAKYNNLLTLPIQSPAQNVLGQKMADRMQYNAAGVSASISKTATGEQNITIAAAGAAKVPVTGLRTSGAEFYGGQYISYASLSAGQSATYSLAETQQLSVTKTGTGSGTVTSSPAGVNCGATCSANFTTGTVVKLTAKVSGKSTFGGWSGACSSTSLTCTVTMDTAKSVTAAFRK